MLCCCCWKFCSVRKSLRDKACVLAAHTPPASGPKWAFVLAWCDRGYGGYAVKLGYAIPVLLAFVLLSVAASAQNSSESVTVTGQAPKTRTEIMHGFARSYVAPSRLTGKLARWVNPICPLVIGLQPDEKLAVRERIIKNAKSVGAPVQAQQACRPNVIFVFAMAPQELMTKVIEDHWNLARTVFGDIDGRIHARKLSKISSPIQAW